MEKAGSLENKVMEIALKFISKDIPPEKIRFETEFAELGINSINFSQLLVVVEEEFGFVSEDEKLHISNYSNLKELIAYVKTKVNSAAAE